ncbi:hypothetical protein P4O66_007218 [Electrophorus voltai]|uniref:Transcription elongation factor, mitochondrial n=1 Tax=Electrophorus voltai TaxID=2609070 RepID=A0AAD8ZK06_9TELE|nr:hypothetical protein P4O66_007218 [Electrophorus voltai]
MWVITRLLSSVVLKGPYRLICGHPGPLPGFELRFVHCTRRRCGPIPAPDAVDMDALYTQEQRAVILRVLNTAPESELVTVKLLRGRKAANILEHRSRHGPFKDLESVLHVPFLKHRNAVVVFNSILNPGETTERKKRKTQLVKFIRPEMTKAQLKASSIVSIVCGTNKIAWAHMHREMTVLDWQQQECSSFMNGTYMASSYLDDISDVVSNLPPADFYVVEKTGVSVHNVTLFPVMAHLRTVEAMLFALLNQRREVGALPKVLNMLRTAVGRHFDLMVGESRTSGARAVRRMMTESVTREGPRVTFPRELLLRYRGAFQMSSRSKGEELCDALLQAVAFYELLAE